MDANNARSSVAQAALPLWMDTRALRAFVRAVKDHPAEAPRLMVVREARVLLGAHVGLAGARCGKGVVGHGPHALGSPELAVSQKRN
jgi:hypothetical protein